MRYAEGLGGGLSFCLDYFLQHANSTAAIDYDFVLWLSITGQNDLTVHTYRVVITRQGLKAQILSQVSSRDTMLISYADSGPSSPPSPKP